MPQLDVRKPKPIQRMRIEVAEICWGWLRREPFAQPLGQTVRVNERTKSVPQPRVRSRLVLLEEEVDLHRPGAEPDEGVRRLPGHLIESTQPPAKTCRNRPSRRPQLAAEPP